MPTAADVPEPTCAPPGANSTTRDAAGAETLTEHGSKQCALVTANVNDFVDELELVLGGGGAAVVGATVDGGLTVTGTTGGLVGAGPATMVGGVAIVNGGRLVGAVAVVEMVVAVVLVVAVDSVVDDVVVTVVEVVAGSVGVGVVVDATSLVVAAATGGSSSLGRCNHAIAVAAATASPTTATSRRVRVGRAARAGFTCARSRA